MHKRFSYGLSLYMPAYLIYGEQALNTDARRIEITALNLFFKRKGK